VRSRAVAPTTPHGYTLLAGIPGNAGGLFARAPKAAFGRGGLFSQYDLPEFSIPV